MSTFRVTQRMITANSLDHLQLSMGRSAKVQEQLSTGRVLNRPSDNPSDATAAMRLRSTIADNAQYARNADDGLGWLGQLDTTLQSMAVQVRNAHELALRGANEGSMGASSREAIATEVDQIRDSLIQAANAKYLDRPVFGGITSGDVAYNPDGTFAGTAGAVTRRVADGVTVRVDTVGTDVFGTDGDSLFTDLANLSTALRAGDNAGTRASMAALSGRLDDITEALTGVGARYNRIEQAGLKASDARDQLTAALTSIENTDLAAASVEVQLQEVAYKAALAATSRVIQPSLLDFLR